jgi:hypothetical protein
MPTLETLILDGRGEWRDPLALNLPLTMAFTDHEERITADEILPQPKLNEVVRFDRYRLDGVLWPTCPEPISAQGGCVPFDFISFVCRPSGDDAKGRLGGALGPIERGPTGDNRQH